MSRRGAKPTEVPANSIMNGSTSAGASAAICSSTRFSKVDGVMVQSTLPITASSRCFIASAAARPAASPASSASRCMRRK